jgi:hypothetical protein
MTKAEYMKEWRIAHKDHIKEYNHKHKVKYYADHREDCIRKTCEWQKTNKEKDRENRRRYYYRHLEEQRIRSRRLSKQYRARNPEKIRAYKSQPHIRMERAVQRRLWGFLKNKVWREHYVKYFGCSKDVFFLYIESLFKPGMTWENYGKWHIDHIIPCSAFSNDTPEDIMKCFHYTNMQPLWAQDNLSKNDFMPDKTRAGHKR